MVVIAVLGIFILTRSIRHTHEEEAARLIAFPLPAKEVTLEDGKTLTLGVSLIVLQQAEPAMRAFLKQQGTEPVENTITRFFAEKTQEELLYDAVRQIPLGVEIQYSLKSEVFNPYNKTPEGSVAPIRLKGVYVHEFVEKAPQAPS